MPADMDFVLYFNLAFFSMLGMGMLFGFLRGLKKSIWSFFVTLIFFVIFFLTINMAVNILWDLNMSFLGGLLANVSPALSDATSLSSAVPLMLEEFLGAELQDSLTNVHFLELVTSLSLFVVKIVYTIIYFTVFQLIYRLIFFILRLIIFPSRKKTDKYRSKNRGLGALFGLLSGAVSLYVSLIVFGGLISIADSIVQVLPDPEGMQLSAVEFRDGYSKPDESLLALPGFDFDTSNPDLDAAMDMMNGMVDAYNTNIIVTTQNQLTMESAYTGEEMPMNLYLFDEVLSVDYQENQIAIREEIGIYANVAGNLMNSDYMDSGDLADISGDDIRGVFTDLAASNLFTSIIPIAVEVGADFVGVDISIPSADLYAINWGDEVAQLGEIAATAFDLINAAGVLDGNVDLNTITLDGDDVESLFVALGDSDLVNLAAYVAMEPVLEMLGEELDLQAIITVPETVEDWASEFVAIGAIANEVLSTGISIGDFSSGDPFALIGVLSEIDFTVILGSSIITNAIINILSGETDLIDIAFLTIPDGLDWDVELENILIAINSLATQSDVIDFSDFENLDFNLIADLDLDAINAIFDSKILVATITTQLLALDLGADFPIIIPDSALDAQGYLLKTELQDVVTAAGMIVSELVCPVGDDSCADLGFDIGAMLTLADEDIDVLLAPMILSATVGSLLIDMGGDVLTIPGSALTSIAVDGVDQDVVSKAEIKAAFLAITTLGITDIDNIEVDASILTNLATEADSTVLDLDKADNLFASLILNATLSQYLLDFATGAEAMVVVPYKDQDEVLIRLEDPVDQTEYISQAELTNILEAILALDITDFNNIESIDLGLMLDKVSILLESAIMHATVSKQLMDLTDVIVVPDDKLDGNPLKLEIGDVGKTTMFIDKLELEAAFDALDVLGITDITNVTVDVSILNNLGTIADSTILDTAKSDILFGSTIINATLSKFLLDFTEGAEAFVVVPIKDQDNADVLITATDGTEFIEQAELTNILKAILAINITDFNNVETLDLNTIIDNVSVLLDSAIMHATVSKQLLDLDTVIVVPTSNELGNPVKIETGPVGNETTFIERTELEAVFDALEVLEMTDINNVAIDISILNNLAVEGQPTVLDTAKADVLFSSAVINATLSKYLIDFTSGDDPFIVVPYEAQDGTTIRIIDPVDSVEVIAEVELTNILEAILILDIQDFNAVDTMSLDTILANVDVLLDSSILHASISKQLIGLDTVIVVPTNNELGNPVKVTTGDPGFETVLIDKDELAFTFDALEVLGITDIENVAIDMTILTNLAEDGNPTVLDSVKADTLFASAVINATLSKYILDFSTGTDPFLVVPNNSQDGTAITVTDPVDSIKVITEVELTNVLEAILILDLDSFDSVESLGIDTILGNVSAILDSSIMHASISKQFLDLGTGVVVVPTYHENDTQLVITQGTVDFIDRTELENTFNALEVLGMSDISTMTVDITQILNNLGEDADPTVLDSTKANTLFSSTILKATIAKYILDFSSGATPILQVPQKDENDLYIKTQNSHDTTVFIVQDELSNILGAILALGLSDFDNVSVLSLATIISNKTAILDSTILQATVSKQLIDLGGGAVIIPEFEEDNSTEVLVTRGDVGQELTYIARLELEELFDALEILGIADLDGFDGGVDLSILNQPGAVNTLVKSAILQATISDQVLALAGGGGATLVVIPYETPDGLTDLRRMIGITSPVEMIKQTELENLIDAFVALGFTDVNNLEAAISISTLTDNSVAIFESYTIQATVSNQVLDLESATIVIPFYNDDLVTPTKLRNISGPALTETEYIDKDELIALMAALDVLIPDGQGVSGFDGSVDLALFYDLGPRTILLDSSILQATISKQIIDLGTAIEVPTVRDDSTVVRLTAGIILAEQTEYLVNDEIHALFEALEVLGMGDISEFDSSTLNFDKFMPSFGAGYEANQDALFGSACIQATVSEQIIDLRVSGTVAIPTNDAADLVVSKTVGGTEYILVSEIKHLFNALDVLGFSVTDFDGSLGLTALFASANPTTYDASQDTMLESAIMHATMTDQISALDGSAVTIPLADFDSVSIENIVTGFTYLKKAEIKTLINGMDLLGFSGDLSSFGGSIDLSTLSDSGNQDTVLLSNILHATLSDQIFVLDGGAIIIPSTNDL
ncbi:MAG: hypothetical protein KAU02_02865, partial [Tenericutes bacterium]|nr:hypothetical protein [Mycoplasmatota bacterium]